MRAQTNTAQVNKIGAFWARLKRIAWLRFTMDVFTRFGKDRGGLLAAGLAFFLVLAFVPLLLVGIWILGTIYAHNPDRAVFQVKGFLQTQVFPGKGAGTEVQHLMERANILTPQHHAGSTVLNILKKRGIAGLIGVLTLVWSAMQIFVNGAAAMNAAWETDEKRSWFKLNLTAFALLLLSVLLLALSLAATAFSTAISHGRFSHLLPGQSVVIPVLSEIGAVVVSALMYAVIYRYLPSASVNWKEAFWGGTAAAIGWEIAKRALAVYLLHPNTTLYGQLGNLIVFIGWIYYSMMILLLGVEVCVVYARELEARRAAQLRRTSLATPAADAGSTTGSPLARAKERNRTQRLRRNAK